MKIFLSIVGLMLISTIAGVYYMYSNEDLVDTKVVTTVLPLEEDKDRFVGPQPIPNQTVRSGSQSQIVAEFKKQVEDIPSIKFEGTVVVNNYALQLWHDDYTGGESIFKYTEREGWKLIPGGGGSWNVSELVARGVPQDIATKLLEGRK